MPNRGKLLSFSHSCVCMIKRKNYLQRRCCSYKMRLIGLLLQCNSVRKNKLYIMLKLDAKSVRNPKLQLRRDNRFALLKIDVNASDFKKLKTSTSRYRWCYIRSRALYRRRFQCNCKNLSFLFCCLEKDVLVVIH